MHKLTFEQHVKRFKPYYKWNTFNTYGGIKMENKLERFKPYYKWNTFNTEIN